jgi:hypothetical protein
MMTVAIPGVTGRAMTFGTGLMTMILQRWQKV